MKEAILRSTTIPCGIFLIIAMQSLHRRNTISLLDAFYLNESAITKKILEYLAIKEEIYFTGKISCKNVWSQISLTAYLDIFLKRKKAHPQGEPF